MSVADFRALQRNEVPTKYHNKRVMVDGWPFDSKLEAARYEELKVLKKAGEVAWFVCQCPFRLPGGITYRADFLVMWSPYSNSPACSQEGPYTVEDCKGAITRVSLNKIKQVEELYGLKVTLIKRARKRRQ
jgi:hypothetical protein